MAKKAVLDGQHRVNSAATLGIEADEPPPGETAHVESPIMQLEVMTFRVQGISPLLQNNPAMFIGNNDETIRTGKKKYDDEEEARLRTYKDANDNYCCPAESFTKALVRAAAGKKVGKDFLTNIVKGGVFCAEPFCIIEDAKGKPMTKYAIDRRSVVVGKSRVLRCRPMWANWFMNVALEVDRAVLDRGTVAQLLALAGRFPGVGDYRPEKGGAFGRFKVIE